MADSIRIKGGTGSVPKLEDRELGYSKDKKALYIGTNDGNEKVGDAGWEERVKTLENEIKSAGVFYAIYGETLASEITEAYNSGKMIACKYANSGTDSILWLVRDWKAFNGFTFSSIEQLTETTVEVSDNGWSGLSKKTFATKEYIDGLVAQVNSRIDTMTTIE